MKSLFLLSPVSAADFCLENKNNCPLPCASVNRDCTCKQRVHSVRRGTSASSDLVTESVSECVHT